MEPEKEKASSKRREGPFSSRFDWPHPSQSTGKSQGKETQRSSKNRPLSPTPKACIDAVLREESFYSLQKA